jgi:putative ABC transport system permease protein
MRINVHTAFRALLQNRLQAVLTLSGMSVGVAMVVIVSGLGRGAQLTIEQQIESAGPTLITIRPGNLRPAASIGSGNQDSGGGEVSEGAVPMASPNDSDAATGEVETNAAVVDARRRERRAVLRNRTPPAPIGDAEMHLLRNDVAGVRAVAGSVEGNVSVDADATTAARVIRVQGFETASPDLRGWHLQQGRWPSPREVADGAAVALLTASAAARLWPDAAAPLERTLKLGGREVHVIGVITAGKNDSAAATAIVPTVQLPLPLAQTLLKRDSYDSIVVRTKSVGVTTQVAREITAYLRQMHQLPDDTIDDFRVETQSVSAMPSMGLDPRVARAVHSNVVEFEQASWEEMARSLRQAGRTFTLLLAAAAAVSLVVGGIGVMNIMLVSVVARTREIGLRIALGARAHDVMTQFLVEAVTLAVLGGLIGLGLGALGLAVAKYGLHWATAISPAMLLAAIAMATLTGVVFGYGPARRAAVLDPVVALRAE